MASHNPYHGYIKLPGKELYRSEIRLDFNARVDSVPGETRIDGFSLRMFTLKGEMKEEQPEISVNLNPEQWLDLIDSMKQEFEKAQEAKKIFEGQDKECDSF